jgi:pectinesterase
MQKARRAGDGSMTGFIVRPLVNSTLGWILLSCLGGSLRAEIHLVVGTPAQGGQFLTVQAAVDAVPTNNTQRYVVDILPGIYTERIMIPADKPMITLRGHGPSASHTVLTFNETANTPPNESTVHASTVIRGKDFVAENLTFENSHGPGVQALAIYIKADRAIFDNVRFLGWQDTLRSESGRHYFQNVYVEGSVDFIYGRGTAFFENSTLYAKSSGYLTAQAREADAETNGYVFQDSTITGAAPHSSVYLGRPWQAYSRTVFLDTKMGPLINPAGWSPWGGSTNHQTAYYAEYNSRDLAGNPLDVSQRVSWSHQLSAQEAEAFSKEKWLMGWEPALSAAAVVGDFNRDGLVGGRDFLYWQRVPGLGDLVDWETHYGQSASIYTSAVPEPASGLAVIVVLLLTLARSQGGRRARSTLRVIPVAASCVFAGALSCATSASGQERLSLSYFVATGEIRIEIPQNINVLGIQFDRGWHQDELDIVPATLTPVQVDELNLAFFDAGIGLVPGSYRLGRLLPEGIARAAIDQHVRVSFSGLGVSGPLSRVGWVPEPNSRQLGVLIAFLSILRRRQIGRRKNA